MGKRTTTGNAKVAVAYLRVSTDEQALGPEAQRSAVERWAAAHGVTVAAWHVDQGVSGGAAVDRRPALLAALADLRAHGAGLLVAAKRDRIARDVVVAAMVEEAAKRAGATVTTADGTSDSAGPEGVLLRGMVDVVAQYERALIRARTRAALAVKKNKGERVGTVPFGFTLANDGRTLVEHEGEQEVVRAVRELRAAGVSLRGIVAELARRGLVSRAGRSLGLTQVARLAA